MTNENKTMKDVVAELREQSVGALLDLFELDFAVGELALAAQRLSAAVREIAAEAAQLANAPAATSPDRHQALAEYASNVSNTADAQAAALAELKRGLAGWNIAP